MSAAPVLFFPMNRNHLAIFEAVSGLLARPSLYFCHDDLIESEQYRLEPALKERGLPYRGPGAAVPPGREGSLLGAVRRSRRLGRVISGFLRRTRPAAIVLALDNDPVSLVTIRAARGLGIPTVLLPEGLLKPHEFAERVPARREALLRLLEGLGIYTRYLGYGTGGCDVICASGRRSLEILRSAGARAGRMVVTGQQKYDAFLARRAREGSGPARSGALLYAASTRFTASAPEQELVRAVAAAAREEGCRLRLKLHPREAGDAARLRPLLESLGPGVESVPSSYDAFENVRDADVVVTISSAIVLEALLLGKECVVASHLAGRRRFEYDDYDALHVIGDGGEVALRVREAIRAPKPAANKARLLEDELSTLDGRAGSRAAAVIEELVR